MSSLGPVTTKRLVERDIFVIGYNETSTRLNAIRGQVRALSTFGALN